MSVQSGLSEKKRKVNDFARANRQYLHLLNIAAEDYSGARCCLINGTFAGLQLGTQAIEKTMKAFIALTDSTVDTTKLSHDLLRLNAELDRLGSSAKVADTSELSRWMEFYNARYSFDRQGNEILRPSASSLDELGLLDKIMTHLVANTPSFPAKFRCGVYALISDKFGSQMYQFGAGFWIRNNNGLILAQLNAVDKEMEEDLNG